MFVNEVEVTSWLLTGTTFCAESVFVSETGIAGSGTATLGFSIGRSTIFSVIEKVGFLK